MNIMPEAAVEILLGMLIPLVVGVATVFAVRKIYREQYGKLTSFMVRAFLAKIVLYGLAMVLIVGVYSFQPIPFVVSFTICFTTLHIAEALYFRKLFST